MNPPNHLIQLLCHYWAPGQCYERPPDPKVNLKRENGLFEQEPDHYCPTENNLLQYISIKLKQPKQRNLFTKNAEAILTIVLIPPTLILRSRFAQNL